MKTNARQEGSINFAPISPQYTPPQVDKYKCEDGREVCGEDSRRISASLRLDSFLYFPFTVCTTRIYCPQKAFLPLYIRIYVRPVYMLSGNNNREASQSVALIGVIKRLFGYDQRRDEKKPKPGEKQPERKPEKSKPKKSGREGDREPREPRLPNRR